MLFRIPIKPKDLKRYKDESFRTMLFRIPIKPINKDLH